MNQKVVDCIYAALDEANLSRNGGPPIVKSPDTPIHGTASGLDSLGLINFIVAVEENVEREFGTPIMLSDERALAQEPSPFDSVRELAAYLDILLAETA